MFCSEPDSEDTGPLLKSVIESPSLTSHIFTDLKT